MQNQIPSAPPTESSECAGALAAWHDLSDVKLAEALDDRASFRRFCGFARSELTPEHTALVRFRRELLRRGLDGVAPRLTGNLGGLLGSDELVGRAHLEP